MNSYSDKDEIINILRMQLIREQRRCQVLEDENALLNHELKRCKLSCKQASTAEAL